MKLHAHPRWAFGSAFLFLLFASSFTSAIQVRKPKDASSVQTSEEASSSSKKSEPSSDKLSPREGVHFFSEDYEELPQAPQGIVKRSHQNTTSKVEAKSVKSSVKTAKSKEDSPQSSLEEEELGGNEDSEGEFNREVRGEKNPRIYYDDTIPQGKSKDTEAKYYYPKTYMTTADKFGPSQKKNYYGLLGLSSGKRIPDHVEYSHEHNNYQEHYHHQQPYGHSIPIEEPHHHHHLVQHHEDRPHHHHADAPHHHRHHTPHGAQETVGKGQGHVAVYGGISHGSYRQSLGDKVDVLGRALRVIVPSALLVTGVSALFPNRVHVPTTPNKHRQKRSVFRRRAGRQGVPMRSLAAEPLPSHLAPEMEDIPAHILTAEHRFLDSGVSLLEPADLYSGAAAQYSQRYAPSAESFVSDGFNPFGVFKGPGPEHQAVQMEESIRLPGFEGVSEMGNHEDKNEYIQTHASYREGEQQSDEGEYHHENDFTGPPSTYGPTGDMNVPPTLNSIPDRPTTEMSTGKSNVPLKSKRPATRKPPMYIKESSKHEQFAPSTVEGTTAALKQNYLVKNAMIGHKQNNPVKAEQEFMSTLQNLVTPDVAKIIVENQKEQAPPKEVDLSPDGPVMGLLSSYAQHEKESPLCQKRALCELAVKGKRPQATKFESFLWSVATLVPDVFSEMYDLQEVFHAIREEKCAEFQCVHPNLDLQVN